MSGGAKGRGRTATKRGARWSSLVVLRAEGGLWQNGVQGDPGLVVLKEEGGLWQNGVQGDPALVVLRAEDGLWQNGVQGDLAWWC